MAHPDVLILQIANGSLLERGFDPVGFGTDGSPSCLSAHAIFSEASSILQDLLYIPGKYDYTNTMKIEQDHDGTRYPEVYNAWIASGGGEAYPNIATVPELGKWAVGMGGKKNGERAAKLMLAVAIAKDSDHTPTIIKHYPKFGQLLEHLGLVQGGGAP